MVVKITEFRTQGIISNEEINKLKDKSLSDLIIEGDSEITPDAIHCWFELSYAQYLTIPRTALQSMPDEWQTKFVKLLEELDDKINWRPSQGRYWVRLKDDNGQYAHDPLMDYQRGRRKLPLKN